MIRSNHIFRPVRPYDGLILQVQKRGKQRVLSVFTRQEGLLRLFVSERSRGRSGSGAFMPLGEITFDAAEQGDILSLREYECRGNEAMMNLTWDHYVYSQIFVEMDLHLTPYRQDDGGDYAMQAPQNVLLLRKEELGSFFEENQVNDNLTSFLATHNAYGNNEYTFSNIARLVTTCINEKNNARLAARQAAGDAWDEAQWEAQWKAQHPDWDKVLLIPVNVVYDTSTSSSTITSIEHDLSPSYVRLQGGPTGEELKVEVTYTSFNAD